MSNDDENQCPNNPDIGRRELFLFFSCHQQIIHRSISSGHADLNKSQQTLSNLTNDSFSFNGPRCWTKFRLNRAEVFRCLHE
jgi:hypothetical protein